MLSRSYSCRQLSNIVSVLGKPSVSGLLGEPIGSAWMTTLLLFGLLAIGEKGRTQFDRRPEILVGQRLARSRLTRRCTDAFWLSVTVLAAATTAPDKLVASVSLDVRVSLEVWRCGRAGPCSFSISHQLVSPSPTRDNTNVAMSALVENTPILVLARARTVENRVTRKDAAFEFVLVVPIRTIKGLTRRFKVTKYLSLGDLVDDSFRNSLMTLTSHEDPRVLRRCPKARSVYTGRLYQAYDQLSICGSEYLLFVRPQGHLQGVRIDPLPG